jgi:hypothetical protein
MKKIFLIAGTLPYIFLAMIHIGFFSLLYCILFIPFLIFSIKLGGIDFFFIVRATMTKIKKRYADTKRKKTDYDIDLIEIHFNHNKFLRVLFMTRKKSAVMKNIEKYNPNLECKAFEYKGLAAKRIINIFPFVKNIFIDTAKNSLETAESKCFDQTEKDRMRESINELNKM